MNFLAIDAASLPLPAITVSAFAVLFVVYVYIMKAINAKKPAAEKMPTYTFSLAELRRTQRL